MRSLSIILLCVVAAVFYGITHDEVTARVCVEYFTIGHPAIFGTEDPTLLAIVWGVIATWWVGLLLGIPLALVARAGQRAKRSLGSLVRPIALLLIVMAICALAAGIVAWVLANNQIVYLIGPLANNVPADRHVPFIAVLWSHAASYLVGFVGGMVFMVQVWRSRRSLPS